MNLDFKKLCEISNRTLSDIIEGAFFGLSGWSLDWDEGEYRVAKESLKKGEYDERHGICLGDVVAKMVKMGFNVKIYDEEEDKSYALTKESLEKGVEAFFTKCQYHLTDFFTSPDQCTDWGFIQCCLFGDEIYC